MYSFKSIPEIEVSIAEVCRQRKLNYALTGFSGAARLAPAVRYQRVFVYIDEPEKDVVEQRKNKGHTTKNNEGLKHVQHERTKES